MKIAQSIKKAKTLFLLCVILNFFILTNVLSAEPVKIKVDLFYSEISSLVMEVCGLNTYNYRSKDAEVMQEIETAINNMDRFKAVSREDQSDINAFILLHRKKNTFIIDLVSKKTGKGVNSKPIHFYELSCDYIGNFLSKRIKEGLRFADQIMQSDVDGIIDHERLKVRYRFTTLKDEDILIICDYNRDPLLLENVDIALDKPKHEGQYTYTIPTKEKANISIVFTYKNSTLTQMEVDTDFLPSDSQQEVKKTFTAISESGSEIDFNFIWKNQKLKEVKISPRIIPFQDPKINPFWDVKKGYF